MDNPTANIFILIFLPQHDIGCEKLMCVYVCVFVCVCLLWFFFLPVFGAAPIRTFLNTGQKQ
jgi:hypothetical protein